jgi:DNA repair protein NreA
MKEDIKFETIKKISNPRFKNKNILNSSKLDSTSPPSIFIGSGLTYPNVNVGILSPLERDSDAWIYDDAKTWAKENFSIHDVVKLREGLLNSRFTTKVKNFRGNSKFIDIAKEIAIASKPVDLEIELKTKMGFGKRLDRVLTPHGLKAPLKKAKITMNVKVNRKLDKMMNDEVKSSEGINYLYKNNFDEYTLSKILSVGVLGIKKNKKLVPTRWSITATDDNIGQFLLSKIKTHKWIENHELFFGEFLGNKYLVMLFPAVFSYELFELYLPGSSWNPTNEIKVSTDYENFSGRKNYAKNCAGGYYAARLPILEYLESIKRQASVLVIRLETASYWASLGVWVVRESVRKALNNRKLSFHEESELIEGCKKVAMIKYGYDVNNLLKKSKLLLGLREQSLLSKWF